MHKFIGNYQNVDVLLTTSLNSNHGLSGHLYEVIEYYYYLTFWHNLKCKMLIPFKFTEDEFYHALIAKYSFTQDELNSFMNSVDIFTPRIIKAKNVIFTDGNMYHLNDIEHRNFSVSANNIIFIRCNNNETLNRANIVLQDSRLYDPLPNSTHYVKKILFSKLKPAITNVNNVAMLYCTSNCRHLTYSELEEIDNKYNFDKYIVLSNIEQKVPDKFDLQLVPVNDIFSKFNTYIYTKIGGSCSQFDCSPRFVVECAWYGKPVIYDTPRSYLGLEIRKYDIGHNLKGLELTKDDDLIKYIAI